MHFVSALLFISGAAALGINCRGSFWCDANPGATLKSVREQVGNLIAEGQGNRVFGPGRKSLLIVVLKAALSFA